MQLKAKSEKIFILKKFLPQYDFRRMVPLKWKHPPIKQVGWCGVIIRSVVGVITVSTIQYTWNKLGHTFFWLCFTKSNKINISQSPVYLAESKKICIIIIPCMVLTVITIRPTIITPHKRFFPTPQMTFFSISGPAEHLFLHTNGIYT